MKKIIALINKLIYIYIKYVKKLELNNNVKFNWMPQVIKHEKSTIKIGNNTLINSSNFGYHINMHSRCKLYTDKNGAYLEIGKNCRIHGTCIHAFNEIIIGDNCLIAANTQIIDSNGHEILMENPSERLSSKDQGKKIKIENNVWIGANSIILGGTTIGIGSIIMTGSVVKGVVPDKCIYGGNPARIIKKY